MKTTMYTCTECVKTRIIDLHTWQQCCQYLPLITPCPCSAGVVLSINFVKLATGHFDRPGGSVMPGEC